jgi:hypothetical protein
LVLEKAKEIVETTIPTKVIRDWFFITENNINPFFSQRMEKWCK